jgi:hypothetical protein
MALQIASELVPAGGGTFYLLEDTYIKGGLQALPNTETRDQIAVSNLKLGQLVLTTEDSKLWRVTEIVVPSRENPDAVESVTWEELSLGAIREDAPSDGKTYGRKNGIWEEVSGGGQLNTRQVVIHNIENLPVSESVEFVLQLAVSCIVLRLEVSRPVKVSAFGSLTKDEPNPYDFLATEDHLVDDGSMVLSDGTRFRSRNFSIFSNFDPTPTDDIYFTVESVDDAEGPVTLTITYLPLEVVPSAEDPVVP